MSWWDFPFGWRVLAVLGFLGGVSAVELAMRGRRAVRWRASLFLIAAGVGGAVFGVGVDAVTSSISSVYFAIGKGLGAGDGLRGRALLLGMRAGTSAGVLIGCVYLAVANVPRTATTLWWTLSAELRHPILGALALGLAGGALGALVLPLELLGEHLASLTAEEARPFLTVWAVHSGLYLGGFLGTAVGVARIWPDRIRSRTLSSPP